MFFFSLRLYIFFWCWVVVLIVLFFSTLLIFHLLSDAVIFFSVDIFSIPSLSLSPSVYSDCWSSSFSGVVCLISLVVFLFSSFYFTSYDNIVYFMWLTFLFLASILVLINFSDIFFVMLGWDGLGVVSYLLILFYQSPGSIFSASFTLIINRVGDCLFVALIIVLFYLHPQSTFLFSDIHSNDQILPFLMVAAFITNSALFPFSPWLPVAMAAPTPISSLVHSSTLVTAGLYLIIRNFSYLSYQQEVLNLLLIVGGFTSLYAGLSSVVEVDLNKVVALSTLSHLGFICFALGLGWSNLAFFHLLSHAFFNSSLFMAIGGYISAFSHYQDSRVFSSLFLTNPYFSFVALISEFNLLGLPFLSGFYSNDLVLESIASHPASAFILTLAYINVILTFTYSFRILYSVISSSNLPVFNTPHCPPPSYILLLSLLSLFSILFGVYFTTVLPPPLFWVPSVLNLTPIVLVLLCGFTFLILIYSSFNTLRVKMLVLQSLSSMFSMGSLWGSLSSKGFLMSSQSSMRSVESGLLLSSVVGFSSALVRYTSTLISYPLLWSFQFSILYICIIFLVYIVLAGV